MTAEREFYFANNKSYSITNTVATMMDNYYELRARGADCVYENIFDHIVKEVNKFRFYDNSGNPDFLVDYMDGVVTVTDLWWDMFGVEAHIEDLTIGTVEMDDEDFGLPNEECISDEEEMELVIGAHVLLELDNEVMEEDDFLRSLLAEDTSTA